MWEAGGGVSEVWEGYGVDHVRWAVAQEHAAVCGLRVSYFKQPFCPITFPCMLLSVGVGLAMLKRAIATRLNRSPRPPDAFHRVTVTAMQH